MKTGKGGDSKDPLVSSVSPSFKSGHWKATPATQITEAELNFHKIRRPITPRQKQSWEC